MKEIEKKKNWNGTNIVNTDQIRCIFFAMKSQQIHIYQHKYSNRFWLSERN